MPDTQGAVTRLTLAGVPGQPTLADPPASFVRTYTVTFTRVGLTATTEQPYGSFVPRDSTSQSSIAGTDTWSVSWTEDDVNSIELSPTDAWVISWNETATAIGFLVPVDTWSVNWTESVTLSISGVTAKAGTDTWSVSWTEAATFNVYNTATDTWSVSWTESAVTAVVRQEHFVTDTWSVSWDDLGGISIISGADPRDAGDTWFIDWDEAASYAQVETVFPARIRLILRAAHIEVRLR
jgi:hypothetical protein